ncbi:MAG: LURP-one-related family protein [Caldilineaceae bacterium]|nr:LURP-one-related family protein [Caldilineaceae bacterium]
MGDKGAERGPDRGPDRYRMREKIFDIGDDYWIETQGGRRAYKVDGKALRLRKTLILEDARGRAVYEIQSNPIAIKDKMSVANPRGRDVAVIKHALISPLRDRMSANMSDGPDIEIRGNLLNHEYKMERRGKRVAEVSKRWIALRDTYTVEIAPGEDDALILALTVVVEQMCQPQ